MSFFIRTLDKWRSESEAKRERKALFLASVFTIAVFVVWLVGVRFSDFLRTTPSSESLSSSEVAEKEEGNGGISGAIDRIKTGWQKVTNFNNN